MLIESRGEALFGVKAQTLQSFSGKLQGNFSPASGKSHHVGKKP
jgi:hypothetical protein